MELVALVGPYDRKIRKLIYDSMPPGFTIKEILSEGEYGKMRDVNYIIIRMFPLTESVINSVPNLKLIQRWGVGYETVDIKAAGARGIPVAITSGMNASAVSEIAVLLMLAVYRQFSLLSRNLLEGKWRGEEGITSTSYIIEGKTAGIIGLGNIGKLVAGKLNAFGARVQYYDIIRLTTEEERKRNVTYAGFEELLTTSDIVSLHVPLDASTRHMICRKTIELMRPDALLINTSRGGVVKEVDLIEALEKKRILGAGLDVMEQEPIGKNNPLLQLKNVAMTPHMGGSTVDVNIKMIARCIENIVKVSKGEKIDQADFVNADFFGKPVSP
jgi:D-3-phosphoglycerate dehydrogenase / 2-oxoglutarate reductase